MIKNIHRHKITSGTGIAILVILGLKLIGLDLVDILGYDLMDLSLYMSVGISSILHFISKDPKIKTKTSNHGTSSKKH